jgi:hypothetical protein
VTSMRYATTAISSTAPIRLIRRRVKATTSILSKTIHYALRHESWKRPVCKTVALIRRSIRARRRKEKYA